MTDPAAGVEVTGWKMVPVEPTEAILLAIENAIDDHQGTSLDDDGRTSVVRDLITGVERAIYAAVLATTPPQAICDEAADRLTAPVAEWLAAREAALAEPIADVRKSGIFAAALDRLANAEDALARAARALSNKVSVK